MPPQPRLPFQNKHHPLTPLIAMPVLTVPAKLTRDEVAQWLQDVQTSLAQSAAKGGEAVWIDAAPLAQFDSTALSALLAVQRAAHRHGLAFAGVQGMPAALQSLAGVYGVERLLAAAQPARAH